MAQLRSQCFAISLFLALSFTSAQAICTATGTGVTICTPSTTAVSTSLHLSAGAASSGATIKSMKAYVDGTSVYTVTGASLERDLTLTTGSHRISVNAWDSQGKVFTKAIQVTASTSSGGGGGNGSCQPAGTSPSVTVCAPANGATVSTEFNLQAAAKDTATVTAMKIYVDGVSTYTFHAAQIDTNIIVSTGAHKLTVKAWDSAGKVFSTALSITAASASGGGGGGGGGSSSGLPRAVSLTFEQTQQFTADGASDWVVDGTIGGSSDTGVITADGLYTAPSSAGIHTISATGITDTTTVYIQNQSVVTFHNDVSRTGWNQHEIALTPSTVTSSKFGKLFSISVDGDVYGQPLYMPNLNIGGGVHNVIFVVTEHDSVYAFDADGKKSTPLWKTSFIDSANGVTTVPAADTGTTCCIAPEIGITSTPVIDPSSGTMYVVAMTKESGSWVHRLHALDITSGSEMPGSPVKITAQVSGLAPERDSSGIVHFQSRHEGQRAALLLKNGNIYIAFGSYNDVRPYHGWVLAYDAQSLTQTAALNLSPDGWGSGVWAAGNGISSDSSGNLYLATGNGTMSLDTGGRDYSQTVLKLDRDLNILDYFLPWDWSTSDGQDRDIGSGGAILAPASASTGGRSLIVNVNKTGDLFVMDTSNLGQLGPTNNTQIVQSLDNAMGMARFAPAWFGSTIYSAGLDDPLKARTMKSGKIGSATTAPSGITFPYPGASPAVSSDGGSGGIVWIAKHSGGAAILYAFDATTLDLLFDSNAQGTRDTASNSVRFAVPTVVNGHVYLAGKGGLTVYGLLP